VKRNSLTEAKKGLHSPGSLAVIQFDIEMPRFSAAFAILLAAAVSAEAAAIRGVVVDHFTGRPLARTLVTLEMIQANGVVKVAVRTASSGQFVFSPLNAGAYLLSAARKNYATLKYGQKFWHSPGIPIVLSDESAPYIDLRLHRLVAITGNVWDENEVGIAEQEVYAYRASRPPVLLARAKTDDRGVYRIGGLNPGQFLIRTGAKQLDEETGVLPTFYPNAASVEDARVIDIVLDQEAEQINIRPTFGKTFTLSGEVVGQCDGRISVSLISSLEQITVSAPRTFAFTELSPGAYDLVADCPGRFATAAYQRMQLSRDTDRVLIQLAPVPVVQLSFEDHAGKPIDPQLVSVLARRKDLSGEGPPQRLRDGTPMLPGRWELTVAPAGNLYPVSISGFNIENPEPKRADAWNEFLIPARGRFNMKVVMSSGAPSVHGRVTKSLGEAAVGAPVYLEAYDPTSNKRLVDLRKTLTGPRGEYRFSGLTPGSYRVVSSFEFDDPDERMMETARAATVSLESGKDLSQDLDLYTAP